MNKIKYYKVGGWVRDKMFGQKSKDIDYAVEAPSYEAMKEDIIARGCSIFLESPSYLTIRASHPKFGGVDYVLCRKDGEYLDGRHPESVEPGTIYDDLSRRDFRLNAMAEDDETGEILDPFGGQKDIKDGIIRCVGNPSDRFYEDSLRILRAIRFALRFKFDIHEGTSSAMKAWSKEVAKLPTDRIRDELERCFKYSVQDTFYLLEKYSLLDVIFDSKKELWLLPTTKER